MSIGKALGRVGVVLAVAVMVVCGGGSGSGDGGNSKAEGGSSKAASGGKGGSFTDPRDKQKYRAVKIGGTTWMAENLNIKIGNSWCYDMEESNCEKYGRLYDWKTAKTVCPNGWHLPSRSEWDELVHAVGGDDVAGTKLKSKSGWDDYTDWLDDSAKSGNGTDDYGFSALPGGYRSDGGNFYDVGESGSWLIAEAYGPNSAYYLLMKGNGDGVGVGAKYEAHNGSVRCVKDN